MTISRILIFVLTIILLIASFPIVNANTNIEENIEKTANTLEANEQNHSKINQNESILTKNETNSIVLKIRKDILLIEIEELDRQIQLCQAKMNLLKELRHRYLHENKTIPVTIYLPISNNSFKIKQINEDFLLKNVNFRPHFTGKVVESTSTSDDFIPFEIKAEQKPPSEFLHNLLKRFEIKVILTS